MSTETYQILCPANPKPSPQVIIWHADDGPWLRAVVPLPREVPNPIRFYKVSREELTPVLSFSLLHDRVIKLLQAHGVTNLICYDALIEQIKPRFFWTCFKYVCVSEILTYSQAVSDNPPSVPFARLAGGIDFLVNEQLRRRLVASGGAEATKVGFQPLSPFAGSIGGTGP